jgi:coenzyme F420-reducing hydrogenase delta subunit
MGEKGPGTGGGAGKPTGGAGEPAGDYPLSIRTENCGNCVFCVSVCPFEALKIDEATKKVRLDKDKCRLCGLCYTSCPSGLIEIDYYNKEALAGLVDRLIEGTDSRTLVMACRGSEPPREKIIEELGTDRYIGFTLPCVGRVPLPFYLGAAEKGIEKIVVFSCEEDFCRFKKGATALSNTVNTAGAMLGDMGYPEDLVSFKRGSRKVVPDEKSRCISCGNCVARCPYQGVKLESGSAKFDLALCKGCGVCVAECPVMCLEILGSESPVIDKALEQATALPDRPRILAFMCMWSDFTALDSPGAETAAPPAVHLVPLPCAGRLELVHVVDALLRGVDGVVVATCPEEECRQERRGPRHAATYEAKLESLLKGIGLAGRVARFTATPKRPGDFVRDLELHAGKIRSLGPLTLTDAQREELAILKDLLSDVRMRWLLSREGDMLEKGNVYGERVSLEQWNKIFDEALRDRRVQHAILRRARGGPVTAGEIAASLKLPPPVVVRHIIDLKRQNLLEMCHGPGPQKFAVKGGCQ